MDFPESKFLIEILIEDIRNYTSCKMFTIVSQFADIFKMYLKDPNEIRSYLSQLKNKALKKKIKERKIQSFQKSRVLKGQSILFAMRTLDLLTYMNKYPMELSFYSKSAPKSRMGSTLIPWSKSCKSYLKKVLRNVDTDPFTVIGIHNVFNEEISKCMAVIKINIRLTHVKNEVPSQFIYFPQDNSKSHKPTNIDSQTAQTICNTKPYDEPTNDTGIIKTIYSGNKKKHTTKKPDNTLNKTERYEKHSHEKSLHHKESNDKLLISKFKSCSSIKTCQELDKYRSISKSSTNEKSINILDYVFRDDEPLKNQVYCVGYFTVQNDTSPPISNTSRKSTRSASNKFGCSSNNSSSIVKEQSPRTQESPSITKNSESPEFNFKICDEDCATKKSLLGTCKSSCSVDLPVALEKYIKVKKCDRVDCYGRKHIRTPPLPDDRILLDLNSINVVGEMNATMNLSDDPCMCSCKCEFGFSKKTTYCKICRGYETIGNDPLEKPNNDLPHPCPVFHKLIEKGKLSKTASEKKMSNNISEPKKKKDDEKLIEKGKLSKTASEKKISNNISEPKKKKDDRFKFNYGYIGIPPKIGHSKCTSPCTGTLDGVPKNMGWLWTAEDVPGLKFRPMWKPGATNKHVVRMLRIAKNPGQITKKRKKVTIKKKPLKRPLLIVHKKDGEFTVTMETMKTKPRTINQAPYEDKPELTYTVGRTDEENLERKKRKERERKRLEKDQREFIQNTFKDMCRDICLKTYQQALGILPGAEDPACPCLPANPGSDIINANESCSCFEDDSTMGSVTDSDEWYVEYTPPVALFNPKSKVKKIITQDNSSQYTYLDYRVKLLDRNGNPVPRFFKGPDGKQQCSDLGGFWSPDHTWLEINIDGYIAPDGKWAPNIFIGPSGEQVDAETGKFQTTTGEWYIVGVDGFVDCQGHWRYYSKQRAAYDKARKAGKKTGAGDRKDQRGIDLIRSETTWSCFGDASPILLSKMGIVGHGPDKKLLQATLKEMMARGEDVKIPKRPSVPKPIVSKKSKKNRSSNNGPHVYDSYSYFLERNKCKHPVPSEKGITAVDEYGNKTFFKLRDQKNQRPKQRLNYLNKQGISLSSFHVPCLNSFISSEVMKEQLRQKLLARLPEKSVTTQTK